MRCIPKFSIDQIPATKHYEISFYKISREKKLLFTYQMSQDKSLSYQILHDKTPINQFLHLKKLSYQILQD